MLRAASRVGDYAVVILRLGRRSLRRRLDGGRL